MRETKPEKTCKYIQRCKARHTEELEEKRYKQSLHGVSREAALGDL